MLSRGMGDGRTCEVEVECPRVTRRVVKVVGAGCIGEAIEEAERWVEGWAMEEQEHPEQDYWPNLVDHLCDDVVPTDGR